ncbi:YciI family protein [Nocardia sp. CDC153]|uniref:YciI family protein n=1 Tax=Nocardia sp. CDC153 TaxID=3112167 RepID=UPI002DB9CF83|nr:YciI family protein [Nocardia sp. CDC153]MEC3954167.1 YciI family protein [Nocardia sp. CDC153]
MAVFAVHYVYSDTTAPTRDIHRPEHRAWLNALVDEGTVLTSGPYPDGSGALILVRGDSLDAVTKLFENDPFARENLLEDKRIVEWLPTMGAFVS